MLRRAPGAGLHHSTGADLAARGACNVRRGGGGVNQSVEIFRCERDAAGGGEGNGTVQWTGLR